MGGILRNLPICPNVNIRTRLINKSPTQPLIVHDVCYTHWCLSSVSFSQSAAATANTISKLKLISLHNKNLPKQMTCGGQKQLPKAPRVPQPWGLQGFCISPASLTRVPPPLTCLTRLTASVFCLVFSIPAAAIPKTKTEEVEQNPNPI